MRNMVVPSVCGLVGIVLWNGVVYLLAQRAHANATLTTLQANQVVSQWAEAARMRDYDTTDAYMQGVDPLTLATWREANEHNVRKAWIGSYVGAKLTPQDTDFLARVQWSGDGPYPVCMNVRITRQRQITPLSMPRFCKPGTEL